MGEKRSNIDRQMDSVFTFLKSISGEDIHETTWPRVVHDHEVTSISIRLQSMALPEEQRQQFFDSATLFLAYFTREADIVTVQQIAETIGVPESAPDLATPPATEIV
jgi:hypothetical protein